MHYLQVGQRLVQPCHLSAEQQARLDGMVAREWVAYNLQPLSSHLAVAMEFLTSKEKCPKTGAVVITPASQRRGWWASYGAREYPFLADAALRLLSVHPTACAAERNWSVWGQVYTKLRSRLSLKLAQDIVFIRGNRAANVSE